MTSIFSYEIIVTTISKYLNLKENIRFSSINRELYFTKLNPKYNAIINTLYRQLLFTQIYLNDMNNKEIAKNKDEFLDDYKITNNDWKQISISLINHYHNYKFIVKKNYAKDVFYRFQIHLYLPFVRKSNKVLENEESSLHQLFFYDFHLNNRIYSHYDKFLDLENDGFKEQNSENFIYRKNLLFENEFKEFNHLVQNVKGNDNYIIILKKMINYDYLGIDKQYYNNKTNNEVFDFIIWLNHSAILFSQFLYSLIKIYCYESKNELTVKYIKAHNSFVNFSLSVNECYNNVNIIINYLYRFIKDKAKPYNEFSLYKMFFNIMKREIFDKLQKDLESQFKILVEQYCKELFDFVDDKRTSSFGSNAKTDSGEIFEDDEELDMIIDELPIEEEENNEITKIDKINNFMSCITDFNIDEKNALCINHSDLKMDDNYKIFENILIDVFEKEVDNCINKVKKPIDNIFTVTKNILSIKEKNDIAEVNRFNFINRTKKLIFDAILSCLKKNIFHIINNEFSEFLENFTDNNKEIIIENKKNMNNQYLKEMIDELEKEEKLKIENIYEDILNKMKIEFENIANKNSKFSNNIIVNSSDVINKYFENKQKNFVILKTILFKFYLENKLYSDINNRITYLLKINNNSNSTFS